MTRNGWLIVAGLGLTALALCSCATGRRARCGAPEDKDLDLWESEGGTPPTPGL
ncbi:hypothetical protein N8I74_17725 [Chitiniphilus purpureus]|uniref:Transmembrane protein n=1 Tax=Chitiniphilus purpureus TaxID=2981137 RepID=A0ABY6DL96_9NEIS|nr:hypothetical protein [Chitiniphilus sp. CD1]UXY15130.1 hypothetical protein N8I74_17725 [Chitiniphilus sp. CD1]